MDTRRPAEVRSKVITVGTIRPFSDNRAVASLKSAYSEEFIRLVKEAIRNAEPVPGHSKGGWLPEHKTWFCELSVLPHVRLQLERHGYTFVTEGSAPPRPRPPVPACPLCRKLPVLLEEWAWTLKGDYEDDPLVHQAIDRGHDLLREWLLETSNT
jgi:hypothetical protein